MSQPAGTKLYVVKLCSAEQALEFYDDMETPGGALYIPDRAVPEVIKKPNRLTITYYLTPEEAELVKNDPRVESVELHYTERGIKDVLLWNQTADFWKGNYTSGKTTNGGPTGFYQSTDKNWGLVKVITGENTGISAAGLQYQWGQSSATNTFRRLTNISLSTLLDGEHVDVVIVDGHLRANHAEFAVNTDGSGGTRFVNYNWFQHAVNNVSNVDITKVHHPSAVGQTYSYTDTGTVAGSGDHGSHVAGTVAGNTQGFARKAKIYNISIFDNSVNYNVSDLVWDYIRAFHESKSINPLTGKKNPTVVNASIGRTLTTNSSLITGFVYRGVTYTGGTFSNTGYTVGGILREWEDLGISEQRVSAPVAPAVDYTFKIPISADDVLDDIDDMISSGVIYVTAAGNENWLMDISGGLDYNNQIIETATYYHNRLRGFQTQNSIVVANAMFDYLDYLNSTSNRGPAITITAPGTGIISAVSTTANDILDDTSTKIGDRLADPRNLNSDKLEPYNGTSMASPHVAGVIALLASANPDLTNTTALSFLNTHAKTNTMLDFAVGNSNYKNFALKGTVNKFLYLPPQSVTGTINKTTVTPNDLVTVTIGGINLPTGSIIYWTTTGTAQASDFADSSLKGNVILTAPSVTLTRTINSSATAGRNFQIQLRTGGETGNIHVTTNTITIDNSTTTSTTSTTSTTTSTTSTTTSTTSTTTSTTSTTTSTTSTTTSTTSTTTSTTSTTTSTTTTTQAPTLSWRITSSSPRIGLDECCGKDEHSNLYFSFRTIIPTTGSTTTTTTPPGSTTTTTTTTTTPPDATLSENEIYVPIKDLVKFKDTGRKFIARLRTGSQTGPIVANSQIVSIDNLPVTTALRTSFTDIALTGKIYTSKTKGYYQKTIIDNIPIPESLPECYDDRIYVKVVGSTTGNVYGGGTYRDGTVTAYSEDSDIGTAAVHAGLVLPGQTALVRRQMISYYRGLYSQFIGSTRNGVTSLTRAEGCGYYFDTNATSVIVTPPRILCRGELVFDTPGEYDWIAPDCVDSVSVLAIGGGGGSVQRNDINGADDQPGGGGGGLAWMNNIPVVAGQSYRVVVGAGGGLNQDGGTSYFIEFNRVAGFGGKKGQTTGQGGEGGIFIGEGGGQGGDGGRVNSYYNGGGGGAGGYAGKGGNGAYGVQERSTQPALPGSGGGGGGGGNSNSKAGTGGGTGIYGIGVNGAAGLNRTPNGNSATSGGGGSGGLSGVTLVNNQNVGKAGKYGGGGAGNSSNYVITPGGSGVVRLIWPGLTRRFPATDVGLDALDDFAFLKQSFTASSNQTVFTVTRPDTYTIGQCLVFQNGVLLNTNLYSDSSGAVTFTNSVTTGDTITIMSFISSNVSGVYPSFFRETVDLTYATEYTPNGYILSKGYELIYFNGCLLIPDQDYVLGNGVISEFPAIVSGQLTIIRWTPNNKSQPNGNPVNTTRNTVIAQATYNAAFDPIAFNLYNNGVLMLETAEYTLATNTYTFIQPPTSNLNILLQQTFTRTGTA